MATVVEGAAYTVVARRYRPQRLEDVVGQDHVVQTLRNAINLNRVTHAYLFCGTRGVGKTSIARIFAKCLNCVKGPTATPDLTCPNCQAIALGQDVDVIEIDGASNNGVDQIRELKQNSNLQPSHSRFKIYYIDEVHMLSNNAFNALLKLLEEPPKHVKFIFATTEPKDIPATILSRCQRHDLASISPDQIVATLAEICTKEEVDAEVEALGIVARKAAGSMRDAQSLLEQLLSMDGQKLTTEVVQRQLGVANDESVVDLIECLARKDAAGAIQVMDVACGSGSQPADVLSGALEFLRDAMIVASGAKVAMLSATPAQRERLREINRNWNLGTLLMALQILAEARGKLRGSPHGRTICEIALMRVALLENFEDLGKLVGRLESLERGEPPAPRAPRPPAGPPVAQQASPRASLPSLPMVPPGGEPPSGGPQAEMGKTPAGAPSGEPPRGEPQTRKPPAGGWNLSGVTQDWLIWAAKQPEHIKTKAKATKILSVDENTLVLVAKEGYNWVVDALDHPFGEVFEASVSAWAGRSIRVEVRRHAVAQVVQPRPVDPSLRQQAEADPTVQYLVEQFGAQVVKFEPPAGAPSGEPPSGEPQTGDDE